MKIKQTETGGGKCSRKVRAALTFGDWEFVEKQTVWWRGEQHFLLTLNKAETHKCIHTCVEAYQTGKGR